MSHRTDDSPSKPPPRHSLCTCLRGRHAAELHLPRCNVPLNGTWLRCGVKRDAGSVISECQLATDQKEGKTFKLLCGWMPRKNFLTWPISWLTVISGPRTQKKIGESLTLHCVDLICKILQCAQRIRLANALLHRVQNKHNRPSFCFPGGILRAPVSVSLAGGDDQIRCDTRTNKRSYETPSPPHKESAS